MYFNIKVVTATIKRALSRERVGGYAAGGSQCIDEYIIFWRIKTMKNTTANELRTMCENIREELNKLYEADFTDAEIEAMQDNGEATSLYDYFNDVLDYEFTINSDKSYKSVKIWVTLGGPNICIDTGYNEIKGFWGSDRESAWLPSEIAEEIDSIFEELYNC